MRPEVADGLRLLRAARDRLESSQPNMVSARIFREVITLIEVGKIDPEDVPALVELAHRTVGPGSPADRAPERAETAPVIPLRPGLVH